MPDILSFLYNQIGFDRNAIKESVSGEIYTAVMLKNGHIGLCTTYQHYWPEEIPGVGKPSRSYLQAYFNALLNYDHAAYEGDLFTAADFGKYKKWAMIGYFRPIFEQMKKMNIETYIFDLNTNENPVLPVHERNQYLSIADAVIITANTITNNTFDEVTKNIPDTKPIFIIGPSTPLYSILKEEFRIYALMGARFKPFDYDVLIKVAKGEGGKEILKSGQKVFI